MLKSQASTKQENFTFSLDTNNNQSDLLRLVNNLELQLGYHAIALKKAQNIIQILKSDNNILIKENQLFKNKCQSLQLQIVKLMNEINKQLDYSYSYNNIHLPSHIPKTKPEVLHAKKPQNKTKSNNKTFATTLNIEKYCQVSETPVLNKRCTLQKQRETSFAYLLQDSIETSPGKPHKPKYAQQIFMELKRKCQKQNKHQQFQPQRIAQTLSFIPFQQISMKKSKN